MIDDPNWPLHAVRDLGADADHAAWPIEPGWWLMKRARPVRTLGLR